MANKSRSSNRRREPPGAAKAHKAKSAAHPAKPFRRPLREARAQSVGGKLRLPRVAKGRRAQFYDDVAIDQLMAIVAALTAELSVAFERLATLERVLERRGGLDRAEIEAYEPGEGEAVERAADRESLIGRVFQVLEGTEPPS